LIGWGVALLVAMSRTGIVAQGHVEDNAWFWLIAGWCTLPAACSSSLVRLGNGGGPPNIDGCLDEALWISLLPGLLVMLVAWIVSRRTRAKPPDVLT
jgi:hypothetical protein